MTHFLYAKPSFIGGAAYIMDLGNTLLVFNESVSPEQADYFAIKSDWIAIGDDLRNAILQTAEECGSPEPTTELQPALSG